MSSSRVRTILQRGLLLLMLLGLGYWAWNRSRPPPVPTYEGKTLAQWIEDLGGSDYTVSDRAAEALVRAGPDAVPVLLEAGKHRHPFVPPSLDRAGAQLPRRPRRRSSRP